MEYFQWNAPGNLAPKGAGLLKLKVFWRQKARSRFKTQNIRYDISEERKLSAKLWQRLKHFLENVRALQQSLNLVLTNFLNGCIYVWLTALYILMQVQNVERAYGRFWFFFVKIWAILHFATMYILLIILLSTQMVENGLICSTFCSFQCIVDNSPPPIMTRLFSTSSDDLTS